jgi:probable aminopeptidase NPEPL1
MHHAGVVARTKAFEDSVYAAGQRSGDWCFPLLYAPEILEKEFESKVADMKNSVKVR